MHNSDPVPEALSILVVEDDAFVRAVVVDALEDEGFQVLEAPSADYAVTLLEDRKDIGVLVTSGALPSGFSGEAPQARFVPKPYRMSEVIRIIRGMTAQSLLCVLGVGMHASWYLNAAH
jgi:CheY-like chemotaxis protein